MPVGLVNSELAEKRLDSVGSGFSQAWVSKSQNLKNVIIFICLLLHNKVPQTLCLKTAHICYLTVSVGQESGHGLAGSSIFMVPCEAATELSGRAGSHLETYLGKNLTHTLAGRIQFLLRVSVPGWFLNGGSINSLPHRHSEHGDLCHQNQ